MNTMTDHELELLKYPIGKFVNPKPLTDEMRVECIQKIGIFPARLRKEVEQLKDEQLDTAYRPGGWTIRQVVNHCADSHMNGLIRLKLSLTEDGPTIKPYLEARWAELPDSKTMSVDAALSILAGVHERWEVLLKSLSEADLHRTYVHPEHGRVFDLNEMIALYAWHSSHHLAHITQLKRRMGWK